MEIVKCYRDSKGYIHHKAEDCARADGLVECIKCHGSGLESYLHIIPYPPNLPDSGWVPDEEVERYRDCSHCHGLKYSKPGPESDPEYDEYIRLQNKFKDYNEIHSN